MALLEWLDSYCTGNAAVDHEHAGLIGHINALHDGLLAGAGGALGGDVFGGLYAAVSAHFALEEKLMRDHGYDRYHEHKAEHERLLDDIREFMEAYDRGGDGSYDGRFSERICNWFLIHLNSCDRPLCRFLPQTP